MPRLAIRLTWTITRPPQRLVAWASDSISRNTASCSMVTLPSSSAVVPRKKQTSIWKGLKNRYSSPLKSTSSTTPSGAQALCRPPPCRGSTKVCRPVLVRRTWTSRCDLPHQLRQRALRQGVAFNLVGYGHIGNFRRIDEGAADDPLEQALMGEMVGP